MPPPDRDPYTAHLAGMVWAWVDGQRPTVLWWLRQMGCPAETTGAGAWTLQGTTRGARGLAGTLESPAVPEAVAVCLARALAGTHWQAVYPGLREVVATEEARRSAAQSRQLTLWEGHA